MLRIAPHTVPRVGRSYEHFPDGFELQLLPCVGHQVYAGWRLHVAPPYTGYLAHKKTPTPLGPPYDPRNGPTVDCCGVAVSYERGTPCTEARIE